jgi:hypothetical protein
VIRILVLALALAHSPVAVAGLHPQFPRPMPHRSLTGPALMLTDADGHFVTLMEDDHGN